MKVKTFATIDGQFLKAIDKLDDSAVGLANLIVLPAPVPAGTRQHHWGGEARKYGNMGP